MAEMAAESIQEQGREFPPGTNATTLKLITTGRRSGIPHVAMMRFVISQGAYYVFAGTPNTDWFLNALASRVAKVRLGDHVQPVSCEESPEGEMMRGLYTKKYGARTVKDWYSSATTRAMRLVPTCPATLRGAIRGEDDVKLDFRAWTSKSADYLDSVATAFDSASEEYDFTIKGNFINVWTRDRSIAEVIRRAGMDDTLLEIGCGTGTEAIRISRHVRKVVATDISLGMISLLRRKVDARGLTTRIEAIQLRATEIARASGALPGGKARLAYSLNGALNCEVDVGRVARELWNLLEPGGLFICSVRNRLCLEESLSRAVQFRFGTLAPRKRQPIMVSVGGMDIPAYYYSPREFARFFEPYFSTTKMAALPAVIPPPSLNDFYVRLRSRLLLVEKADAALADKFPFNRFGDQTLFVFERRDNPRAAP